MKGVVLKSNNQLALEEVENPRIEQDGDVIIKITITGICGSDIHIKHGHVPQVPVGMLIGHEFVGIVEETGQNVTKFKPGDRVASPCTAWCGVCPECRRGNVGFCQGGGGVWSMGTPFRAPSLRGAQTSYIRAPFADQYLVPIPDGVSDEEAVFVGDILSTGYQAAREGHIQAGDTVVIFGCGPVGLCAIVASQLFGPRRVLAVDLLDNRLNLAKQYGAEPIDTRDGNVMERIRDATGGTGADVAIEAIGNPETFGQALKSIRPYGTLSVVGIFPGPVDFPVNDFCVAGARISMGLVHPVHMHELMGLVESGRIDLKPLGTHHFSLDEIMTAYDLFEHHPDQCVKVYIKP